MAEPSSASANLKDRFQFLRMGYFCLDKDSTSSKLIFNRTATLRDMWAKEVKK
jgi:glutaminyl-tRNA synthetase